MKKLFSEHKNKIFSTAIVTMGAFLGFEAVSYSIRIYQLSTALQLSIYIYFFHIFWLTFIFDLHLKKISIIGAYLSGKLNFQIFKGALKERFAHVMNWQYFRHYQNYLVLPGIIYWTVVVLLFSNPFNHVLKQSLILLTTFAMGVAYWYMKEHVSRKLEHDHEWIKILAIVKLFAAFTSYSALLAVSLRYGYGPMFLFAATLALTFFLIYQALFQHKLLNFDTFMWVIIISFFMGIVALWVYDNWNTQYFTGGLVMLSVYNSLWGILHNYLDKTLNRRVVFDYLVMTIFIISVLFASHNFNQRIV